MCLLRSILLIPLLFLFSKAESQTTMRYLALGDSYTIGESVTESERWPIQLVDQFNKKGLNYSKPTIIATTGWRTDNLMNAIAIANLNPEYDLVSLLIGVNNQYQGKPKEQYAIEFEKLLTNAIQLVKGNKEHVFVVSIPDYGFTTFGEKNKASISKEIDEFNSINKKITDQYKIKYIDITPISRQGLNDLTLIAKDGLHPSGKMYAQWVVKIMETVKQ